MSNSTSQLIASIVASSGSPNLLTNGSLRVVTRIAGKIWSDFIETSIFRRNQSPYLISIYTDALDEVLNRISTDRRPKTEALVRYRARLKGYRDKSHALRRGGIDAVQHELERAVLGVSESASHQRKRRHQIGSAFDAAETQGGDLPSQPGRFLVVTRHR